MELNRSWSKRHYFF